MVKIVFYYVNLKPVKHLLVTGSEPNMERSKQTFIFQNKAQERIKLADLESDTVLLPLPFLILLCFFRLAVSAQPCWQHPLMILLI